MINPVNSINLRKFDDENTSDLKNKSSFCSKIPNLLKNKIREKCSKREKMIGNQEEKVNYLGNAIEIAALSYAQCLSKKCPKIGTPLLYRCEHNHKSKSADVLVNQKFSCKKCEKMYLYCLKFAEKNGGTNKSLFALCFI